jgi:hypothetical protein
MGMRACLYSSSSSLGCKTVRRNLLDAEGGGGHVRFVLLLCIVLLEVDVLPFLLSYVDTFM